jgi:hypothetical protein
MDPEQRRHAKHQDTASADDLLRRGADKAIASGLRGWWQRRSVGERLATGLILGGLAIGPLGLGIVGALGALFTNGIPTSKQIEAVGWLLLITAPLSAACLIVAWAAGKHGSVPVVLGVAAAAAVLVSTVLSNSTVPNHLAGLYCYAEVVGGASVYEKTCRDFKHAGFIADNSPRVSPSGAIAVFGSALAYTVDARGLLMAIAAVLVSTGIGLLLREHT